jgi:hypothetical protein
MLQIECLKSSFFDPHSAAHTTQLETLQSDKKHHGAQCARIPHSFAVAGRLSRRSLHLAFISQANCREKVASSGARPNATHHKLRPTHITRSNLAPTWPGAHTQRAFTPTPLAVGGLLLLVPRPPLQPLPPVSGIPVGRRRGSSMY